METFKNVLERSISDWDGKDPPEDMEDHHASDNEDGEDVKVDVMNPLVHQNDGRWPRFIGGASPADIKQGDANDCWLLSAMMIAAARDKDAEEKMAKQKKIIDKKDFIISFLSDHTYISFKQRHNLSSIASDTINYIDITHYFLHPSASTPLSKPAVKPTSLHRHIAFFSTLARSFFLASTICYWITSISAFNFDSDSAWAFMRSSERIISLPIFWLASNQPMAPPVSNPATRSAILANSTPHPWILGK